MNETRRDHAAHDELLVAAYASDDLDGRDAERAAGLVAGCADCSRLASDIRELRTNIAALPAPRRTRDFRLTDADAARLRPAGWRGLLTLLAGPRLSFAAPVGTAIATLGIAGLLVATAPSLFTAGTASAPALSTSGGASVQSAEGAPPVGSASDGLESGIGDTGVAAAPAPTSASAAASAGAAAPYAAASGVASAVPSGVAGAAPDQTVTSPPLAGAPNQASPTEPAQAKSAAEPAASAGSEISGTRSASSTSGASPLAIVSSVLVIVGLLLVLGRLAARRSQP